ncbi:PP2C family protein-serine/threonine phosphatase [Streptacidiphilus melanogenes]|uniref:PP2C family protein-serine/threonine phosphatase n=1 Tax=Streptacidiphilus melanogenes TaxID=411235 RepID=UPI000693B8C5|nr:SpoIIE family protein phosphatase [Streptacidiphilus melanogenes]
MGAEAPKRDAAAAAIDAAAVVMTEGGTLSSRVLDALPVGVALLDAELRWRYANDAFLRLTGLPAEATSGRPLDAAPMGDVPERGAPDETAAAAQAATLVLTDGVTRELVTGTANEPIRMRLQRIAAVPDTREPGADTGEAARTGRRPGTGPTAGAPEETVEPGLPPQATTRPETSPDTEARRTAESGRPAEPGPGHRPGDEEPRRGGAGAGDVGAGQGGAGQGGAMVLVVALLDAAAQSEAGAAATATATTAPEAAAATAPVPPSEVTSGRPDVGVAAGDANAEERARRRLTTLTAAGELIGTTLDTDTTCAELARFTVPDLADLTTVDILPTGVPEHRLGMPLGTLRLLRAAVAARPELHQQLATLAHPGESVRHREGSLVARSLVAGKPLLLDLAAIDEGAEGAAAISDPATLEVYRAAGIASVLAVPLAARGHLVGALTLARARHGSGEGYSDEDIALIEDLAGRAALSIDNARRYMRSQGIALELQRALLAEPANPHPNMEIACRYLPSGSSSVVGGDWYESVRLPFGRTLLVIGDVMGHGVEAAVDMSTYRSMLRYVAAMDLPPHRILRQLDAMISENDAARPATCLLALVDPARDRVTFASAGHLPPALVSPSGVTELVPVPSGPPLGTGVGGYQQLVRELAPGAVLLLYTDGLVERRHEDIDVSLERLAALPLPAAGDLDDLLDAALHSSTPSEAEDDIAVLAARVRPRPS